ncbi:MAG: mechanosensitive ion channel [Bacteroidales bacterium]|nr:mechanosensitive ion channel [Bacteroidales bacterium]
MKKVRAIAVLLLLLATAGPTWAVFYEKDMKTTLSILLQELRQTQEKFNRFSAIPRTERPKTGSRNNQRVDLDELTEECNALSLMLYSQSAYNFTFDLTYALDQVAKQYYEFSSKTQPFEQRLSMMKAGEDRYSRLAKTLRKLPDNPEYNAVRDSCVAVAQQMAGFYSQGLQRLEKENDRYQALETDLEDAYNYAQQSYEAVQQRIFLKGQPSLWSMIERRNVYFPRLRQEVTEKYGSTDVSELSSPRVWSGSAVLFFGIMALGALVCCFLAAWLIAWLCFKFIPLFQKNALKSRQRMITLLLGIVFFGIFSFLLGSNSNPYWVLISKLLRQYTWLLAAIFASLLIRTESRFTRNTLAVYLPSLLLSFITILFRIIFIPNTLLAFVLPALLLVFAVWQFIVNLRRNKRVPRPDMFYMWISFGVMVISFFMGIFGYSMAGLLLLIWWFFQLTLLQTITALYILLQRYHDKQVSKLKARYHEKNPGLPLGGKESFIEVTWLYDFFKEVVIPVTVIISVPMSVFMAGDVFNMTATFRRVFFAPLLHFEGWFSLSLSHLCIMVGLFFFFRYLVYLINSLMRVRKIKNTLKKLNKDVELKENDVNLSLANTLVSVLCWLLYIIIGFSLLQIPTSALTVITTGLAAGVGFALKDVLNNFFYGVQLMSGRVRVGDVISCEGVRGVVRRVSYQTTLIEEEDGSLIAFTNTNLFSKNFRNLTGGKNYEMLKIPVGVKYGTDIEKTRRVILEALKPLQKKDRFGRDIVDPKRGIDIRFDKFGDSSVDLIVFLYTTVDTHYTFPARAKELIYNALNENGIEIPFPQTDIYVKSLPENKEFPEKEK